MTRQKRVSEICTAFEDEARACGHRMIAGVDEVGRGALAGPVVAAAVILDPAAPLPEGLDDSKKLTALQRERIAEELKQTALCYGVGLVPPEEIDSTNILIATRRAKLYYLRNLRGKAARIRERDTRATSSSQVQAAAAAARKTK